ncbi:hypothetical protein BH20ACI1_BH20ACI1_30850 [soil metagenome]
MSKYLAASVILLWCLTITAKAQYRFDSWTTDSGLPQNSVFSILQTADGYIWFTTLDGLVRFDGVKFKVFNRSNSPGLTSNRLLYLLAENDNVIWVGTEDGAAALERLWEFEPDVAVLDVEMPNADGFEVVREMQKLNLHSQIIFLTMYKDEGLFNQAMDLGVKGYILKDSAIADTVAGIKAAVRGKNYISPPLATFLVNRSQRRTEFVEKMPTINDLTPTELRILKMIAKNKVSREIADELFISIRTVERHRLNICTKLDIHGNNALLKFTLENKQHFF